MSSNVAMAPVVVVIMTWDCGAEMAERAAVTLKASLPLYFAHPHSPWERGTNENTNRWLREYFPKGTPITNDPDYLQAVAEELNNRPQAILDFKKPKEVFAELLTSSIASAGQRQAFVTPNHLCSYSTARFASPLSRMATLLIDRSRP